MRKSRDEHTGFENTLSFRDRRAAGRLAAETGYDEYIKQLIRQVLFTAQGERINRPDFGAGIKRLVFAPNRPATASLAQTLIFQALTTWLGTLIRTDDVQAETDGERLSITSPTPCWRGGSGGS